MDCFASLAMTVAAGYRNRSNDIAAPKSPYFFFATFGFGFGFGSGFSACGSKPI